MSAPQNSSRTAAWRWVAHFVSVLCIAWVLAIWWEYWPALVETVAAAQWGWLVVGLALASSAALSGFAAYLLLVRRVMAIAPEARRLFNLYFVSQLLKHLPGRVWGIGYQLAYGRAEAGAGAWLGVNILHMGAAVYWALAVAVAILAARSGYPAALGSLGLAALLYSVGHVLLHRLFGRPMASPLRWLPKRFEAGIPGVPMATWMQVGMAFLAANLFQHFSWLAYGVAIGEGDIGGLLWLSAAYMLAWFVGYVALLTPSGLGVRELSFVWLAGGQDPQVVALMAIIGRVSYLSVDLLLGGACLLPGLGPRARER